MKPSLKKSLQAGWILWMFISVSSCRSHKRPVNQETKFSAIESKLGINLPEGINQHYIETIASWLGTPYKYGGTTRSGADCSGFVQSVYRDVFKLTVDHQSEALFKKSKQIKRASLKEGDLVFFKIESTRISHVGMHITGDYFIHASTRKGIVVSRLSEPYYAKVFEACGTYR